MEYRLDSNRQYRQYKQAIENPDQMKFARYDLYDRPRPFHKYAFTAENFRLLDADQGELAVKLPADRPWSLRLVEWISQHHSAARKLLEEIDLESVAHVLSTTGGEHGTQAVS
jgi:hypothetical protein